MWFRALRLYKLNAPLPFGLDALEDTLAAHPFRPSGTLELSSHGFEPVLGPGTQAFVHATEGICTLRWVHEEKRLPAGFVREQLADAIRQYEQREGRAPGAQEKKAMREAIEHALLPRLIPHRRRLFASIDGERGWVLVASASSKQAEALLGALRQATGSLPVSPWGDEAAWSAAMTAWLATQDLPEGWALEQSCVLCAEDEEGGTATLRRHDLGAQEVRSHLAAGKRVTRLGLVWRERMGLVLDAKGALLGLKPTDVLLDGLDELDDEDAMARMDQTLALQGISLRAMLDDLQAALGGPHPPLS